MSEPTEPADAESPPLVRPYVANTPTPSGRTWAASAAPDRLPSTDQRPESDVPAEPDAAGRPSARRPLILLAVVGGVAIALTAIGFGLPGDGDHSTAAPAGPGSAGPVTAGTVPGVFPPPSPSPSASAPPVASPSPSASTGGTTRPPATTEPPPPRSDRIVTILSAARDCLDLNGGVTNDGHHIQVSPCNGSDAQVWTLAADGTLRVKGVCAQEAADTTVRVTGCAADRSVQWRIGRDQSIVNVATGHCLALPAKDPVEGHALVGTVCDGGIDQRWTVTVN